VVLGKFEDFVLTALSLQGNNALFIDKSQSERKEILSQFIGVDIFDKLYQKAADENRDNATLIRKFKSDDFTQKLADIEEQLKTDKNEYKLLEISQTSLKEEEELLNKDIIKLNEKIVKLNADSGVSLDELESRHSILVEKKKEVVISISSIQDRITHREELQLTLEELLDGYDEELLEEKVGEMTEAKTKLSKVESEIEKINIKRESLQERKEHLDSHKYNEECEVCMENSQTILEQKEKVNSEINEYETRFKESEEEKLSLEFLIDSLKKYKGDWNTLQDIKEKEDKIARELSQLHTQVSTKETEEVKVETQIDQLEKLIEEYIKNEEQIQKNKEIREEISGVRTKLTSVKGELTTLNKDILRLNGKISALQNQKESIIERINEVKELEEQSKLFDYYLNALSKDGVSYELIEEHQCLLSLWRPKMVFGNV